ncbi:hypothetical protein DSM112329_00956 [Paraconexibacter sp. AEG42_29]|uniref:Uncharacterized protein n=1 Tax=Paraconexibacter sp. AEG42_29 TaxID=2997339 RepID=A0AAU7AR83_9ACTN
MDTVAGSPRRASATELGAAHRAATRGAGTRPAVVRPPSGSVVIPAPAPLVPRPAARPRRPAAPSAAAATGHAVAAACTGTPLRAGVPAASWIDRNPSTAKRPVDASSRDGLHFLVVAFSLLLACGVIGFGMYSAAGDDVIARSPLGALTQPATPPESSVDLPFTPAAVTPPIN